MPSIEDCNKEWQSRSRTEIILKFIAINLSTLTLVAQLGSSLGMPLRSRVWFVIRTAVLPMWSLVTFDVQLVAFLGTTLLEKLEGDSPPVTLLACRAIGMVQTAEVDLSNDEHTVAKLPRHIPLSEARCFFQKDANGQDAADAESPVKLRCRRTKSYWTSQIFNIVLTLIYIAQAITTMILIFRRLTIAKIIPNGEPFTHIDTKRGIAVTSFESQAMSLSMYGVSMSIVYILLQIFPNQWNHVDNGREWRYASDSMGSSLRRINLGAYTYMFIRQVLKSSMGCADVEVFFDVYYLSPQTFPEPVLDAIMDGKTVWLFLLAFPVLGIFNLPWKRIDDRLDQAMGFQPGQILRLSGWGAMKNMGHTLDYARQHPTKFWVLSTDDVEGPSPSTTTPALTGIETLDLHMGKIVFISLNLTHFCLNFLSRDLIFRKVEILSTPAVSESGCMIETKLMAWMWKDPLADSLWAF